MYYSYATVALQLFEHYVDKGRKKIIYPSLCMLVFILRWFFQTGSQGWRLGLSYKDIMGVIFFVHNYFYSYVDKCEYVIRISTDTRSDVKNILLDGKGIIIVFYKSVVQVIIAK